MIEQPTHHDPEDDHVLPLISLHRPAYEPFEVGTLRKGQSDRVVAS